MSQLQVTGEAKIRDIQGPVVANSGVITALDGAANQYVRGDGTLASFPTSGGGGSSVSYYLNGSVNQGTFGGSTYYQMSKNAIVGTGTNFSTSSDGLLAQFITDANDPDVVSIPSGNWNVEFFMNVSASSGALASFYVEIYKYDGSAFTLLATNVATPEQLTNTTTVDAYFTSVAMPLSAMALTDRLAVRIYANVASKTVTLYTEDNRLCQIVTTFSKGILSINNLTDQSQNLTTGTSGTNFAIVSSGDTHTFNLPVASASNTGKLSSTDWSTFNNKQNALTNPITGIGASGNVAYFDGTTSITAENSFNYDASTNRLGVNTTVPNATIGANAGTDSGYSLLLKNSDSNYNSIGFGTDSTYGNLIQADRLGSAPSRNLTLYNYAGFISLTEAGNLGVGLLTPSTGVDIYNSLNAQLWLHNDTSGLGATHGVRLALFTSGNGNLRNFDGPMSISSEGDFQVITLGAENIRVNSTDGKVGIGNPTTVSEMLTVNGSIQQSGVLSALLKTNSTGKIIAAVAGTDYLAPSALSGYVPTSRTLTINGTPYDLSADRSWSVGTITGGGADGRVPFYNGTSGITSDSGFIYESGANRLGVNTVSPNATIGANEGLDSGYSLLLKNSDTNYNGLGFRIDSTYGHMIETTRTGSAIARNLTLINNGGFFSVSEAGNFGFNILAVNTGVDIYASTNTFLWLHNGANTGSTQGARLAYFGTKSLNLRNFEGPLSLTSEGDFQIITLGAENLRVNSANGYIGIGNPSTVLAPLHVYNAENAASLLLQTDGATSYSEIAVRNASSVATSYFRQYSASASGTDFGLSRSNLATFFSNFASNFAIGTQNGGDLIFGTANTERARITDAGNFGIGTTSNINARLTVFSSTEANQIKIGGGAPATVYADSLSTATYIGVIGLATASNNFANGIVAGDFVIGTQKNTPIVFITGTSTSQKMRLTNAGDLGIGTTVPDSKLDVRGEISVAYSADTGIRFWNQERSNWSSIGNTITTTNANLVFRTPAGVALTLQNNRDAYFTTNILINRSSTFNAGTYTSQRLQVSGSIGLNSDSADGVARLTLIGNSSTGDGTIDWGGNGNFNLLFTNNGSERMRITSGGDVCIGTSTALLPASGRGNLTLNGSSNSLLSFGIGGVVSGYIYSSSTALEVDARDSRYLDFNTNNNQRMRITTGGEVLIAGTFNPYASVGRGNITLNGSNNIIAFANNSSARGYLYHDNTDMELMNIVGGIKFFTATTERMRITSGGSVLINRSTNPYESTYKLIINNGTNLNIGIGKQEGEMSIESFNDAVSAGTPLRIYGNPIRMYNTIFFMNYGNGTLSVSGNQVVSSSDKNLKLDDGGIENALDKVLKLNPRYFYWDEKSGIETKERQLGFYAQDVKEALGEEVSNDNSSGKWGIYDRGIIAMNTKAIQELYELVKEQQAKIEELSNKIVALESK